MKLINALRAFGGWCDDNSENIAPFIAVLVIVIAVFSLWRSLVSANIWENRAITDCRYGNTAACIDHIRDCTDRNLREKLEDKYQIATGHSIYVH